MLAIQQLAGVKAVPWGGYPQAERQRIIVGQPELVEAIELDPSQVPLEPTIYPFAAAH
jgi:RNA-binding protein YlmH